MKNTLKYALFGAALAMITPSYAAAPDCSKLSTAVKVAVAANPEKVLEIVSTQVAQNESCACEIVKAAIMTTNADKKLVGDIVTAAIESAPDHVRIIGQCAVAVAPDALAEVQTIVAKTDANAGEGYSAKGGAKDAKGHVDPVPVASNPLDFPGRGPVGPTLGGPGGFPLFPPGLTPPVVTPPSTTPPVATPEDTL